MNSLGAHVWLPAMKQALEDTAGWKGLLRAVKYEPLKRAHWEASRLKAH